MAEYGRPWEDGEPGPERGWGRAQVSRARPVAETAEALMIAVEVPSVRAFQEPEERFAGTEKKRDRGGDMVRERRQDHGAGPGLRPGV